MAWFGTVSAWTALAMGAMFAVNAYFQFATGVSGWLYAATALALVVGGVRSLQKASGGLRLLAGAWGVAAGVLLPPPMAVSSEDAAFDAGGLALALIALAGLALAVLHKETK